MDPLDDHLVQGWTASASGRDTMVHEDGLRTTATFLDTKRGPLFVAYNEPASTPTAGVVICQPYSAEVARNQRRELALAWELSAQGMAVARFHYRGTGHSAGEPEDMTFDQMVGDARDVAAALAERTGVTAISFVGTRLGSLVAAGAASSHPGTPLVLWEPPPDMERYYKEILRARMIGLVKQGKRSPGGKELMAMFADDGFLDVVGNPVAYSVYESTIDKRLDRLLIDGGTRPVLTIQMSIKQEIRPALTAIVATCAAAGIPIATETIPYDEAWWFGAPGHGPKVETKMTATEAVPLTSRFLREDR
ncbi:MAG: alpha/beta hydrolase [Acidimicrobiia bacterium]|nr:alpha/beta hydrolase [Acidimicrobiia bacterium]